VLSRNSWLPCCRRRAGLWKSGMDSKSVFVRMRCSFLKGLITDASTFARFDEIVKLPWYTSPIMSAKTTILVIFSRQSFDHFTRNSRVPMKHTQSKAASLYIVSSIQLRRAGFALPTISPWIYSGNSLFEGVNDGRRTSKPLSQNTRLYMS